MKIGNSGTHGVGHSAPSRSATESSDKGQGGAPSAGGPAPAASATVKLSAAAQVLLDGGGGSGFNAEKVDRMRKAISDGTYKVNAEAIADKLIANAQDLLKR